MEIYSVKFYLDGKRYDLRETKRPGTVAKIQVIDENESIKEQRLVSIAQYEPNTNFKENTSMIMSISDFHESNYQSMRTLKDLSNFLDRHFYKNFNYIES